jgi:hypothetical protein
MASLRDQFQQYYAPDEDAITNAIQTGLVTPDTNVLLSLYRLQREARDELFSLLQKVGDRLWIPYQVGLEFHRNRLTVMSDQEGYFTKTLKELEVPITDLRARLRAFRARIALNTENVQEIEDAITRLSDLVGDAVIKAEEFNEVRLDSHASDEVLERIDALFGNRVGEPMEWKELEDARAEALRRRDAKNPPGYMDRGKADPTGDYLVWKQLMLEAKDRKVPVVLITDDRKEDWYQEFKGRTLGARRELREEMMAEAGVPVIIMTTEAFLRQAGKYLNVEVSPDTVDQAKELSAVGHFTRPDVVAALLSDLESGPMSRFNIDTLMHRAGLVGRQASLTPSPELLAHLLELRLKNFAPAEDDQARRETFEEFIRLVPAVVENDRDEAAKYIADYLVSDQSTREEATQALAWLIAWMTRYKPQESGPSSED